MPMPNPRARMQLVIAALVLVLLPDVAVWALALVGGLFLAETLPTQVRVRSHGWKEDPEARPHIVAWVLSLLSAWLWIVVAAVAALWLRGLAEGA